MSLSALALILCFLILGDSLESYFQLPIPGAVIGLLALFLFLLIRRRITPSLETTSQNILRFLPLYFVPVGVGVITLLPKLSDQWLSLTIVLVLSTVLSIALTAICFNALDRTSSSSKRQDD